MNQIEPVFKQSGERIFPSRTLGFAQHLARYEFSKQFVKGKIVLDIACGAGYGSALLAETAKKVYGVDICEDVITYARQEYKNRDIAFLKGDARNIPILSNSIDVAVSFETLEHITEQDIFLSEIKRVLKKKGILIISTPNKESYGKINNQFHKKELNKKEFSRLLNKYFKNSVTFNQNSVTAINFKAKSVILPKKEVCPMYLIGVCADKKVNIRTYTKIYPYIDDELLNIHGGIILLKAKIKKVETVLNAMPHFLKNLLKQITKVAYSVYIPATKYAKRW